MEPSPLPFSEGLERSGHESRQEAYNCKNSVCLLPVIVFAFAEISRLGILSFLTGNVGLGLELRGSYVELHNLLAKSKCYDF